MPGGFVCSGTMKRLLDPGPKSVKSALAGTTRVSKLFSKRQRQLFAAHAPEGMELDDLVGARPDLRAQASVHAAGVPASARGGGVALPRRLAGARAVDEDDARRRLPAGGEATGVPRATTASSCPAPSRRRRGRRSSSSRRRSKATLRSSAGTCRRRRSCLGGSGARSARACNCRTARPRSSSPGPVAESAEVYLLSQAGRCVGEGAREHAGREAARAGR